MIINLSDRRGNAQLVRYMRSDNNSSDVFQMKASLSSHQVVPKLCQICLKVVSKLGAPSGAQVLSIQFQVVTSVLQFVPSGAQLLSTIDLKKELLAGLTKIPGWSLPGTK